MDNKKGFFIIGVLVVVLLVLLGYYILNHKEEASPSVSYGAIVSDTDLNNIESLLVPYHVSLVNNNTIDGMFHQNNRVNVSSLSNHAKFYLIFKNIMTNEELEKEYYTIYECEEEENCQQEITQDVCQLEEGCQIKFKIREVTVNEYANLYFGDNPSLKHESFKDEVLGIECIYESGYLCTQHYFENTKTYQNYLKRIRYTEYQGEITIYHQYLLHLEDGYYYSYLATEKLDIPTQVITDSVLERYGKTYKSVFRKVDDHYIWIYSEPVV